jgi:catechol 2,3-dioxygenase-like lactoylglutathione lyase family enzyme
MTGCVVLHAGKKETKMSVVTHLDHVALSANDPDALARFYEQFLGMRLVGRLDGNRGVFLATAHRPVGPDIEFFQTPDAKSGRTEQHNFSEHDLASPHVAFRVAALADLQTNQREVTRFGGTFVAAVNHGAVISCRVLDPEGHHIDLVWITGYPMPRIPSLSPIDLEQSEEDVMRQLEALAT